MNAVRVTAPVAAMLVCVSVAPAATAKVAPDLEVVDVEVKAPYFVPGEAELEIEATTENRGEEAAGKTVTRAVLSGAAGKFKLSPGAKVGSLGPGRSQRGQIAAKVTDVPVGQYVLEVCADAKTRVKESDERDNCQKGKGGDKLIYALAARWSGTASWSSSGASSTYSSSSVFTFAFDSAIEHANDKVQVIRYTVESARVSYQGSGSYPGSFGAPTCNFGFSGEREFAPDPLGIDGLLDFKAREGGLTAEADFRVPVTADCGGSQDTQQHLIRWLDAEIDDYEPEADEIAYDGPAKNGGVQSMRIAAG